MPSGIHSPASFWAVFYQLNNLVLWLIFDSMAQTDAGKKKVYVHGHEKADGTKVPNHYRSTPNTSDGPKKTSKK